MQHSRPSALFFFSFRPVSHERSHMVPSALSSSSPLPLPAHPHLTSSFVRSPSHWLRATTEVPFMAVSYFFFVFCFCFCAVTNEEPATVLEQKQNAKSPWPLQTQRQCRVHGEWHAVRRSVTAAQAKNDTATDTTSLIPPGAVGLSVLHTMYRATSTFNKQIR